MRLSPLAAGVGVGLAAAALMLATEPQLVIVWDEGYTLGREARLRSWFRALADPMAFAARWGPPDDGMLQPDYTPCPRPSQVDSRRELLFDRRTVRWFWPFARQEPHGHPPFYALVGLLGDLVVPAWDDLPRARLGPILLFSATTGAVFAFVASRWGFAAAVLAAASWIFQPNLFGHGHYAAYDGVLTSLWVLAIIAFAQAVDPRGSGGGGRPRRWPWTLALGVLLGCAAATKLTGWFLLGPFVAWAAWVRSRGAFRVLAVALVIAAPVLVAFIIPWWTDPVGGVEEFLRSNLTRGETIRIPVRFLGRTYDTPRDSLPWYNTLAWTVLVTPVGFLAMGLLGLFVAIRRRRSEPLALLVAGHWAFLLLLRAIPHTPGHDGVRLFLPAFGALALLGGAGAQWLLDRSLRWGRAAIVAAVAEGVASVAILMPVPLSYFSPVVGGLPGAAALGMEPTYYWDALTPDARRWLVEHTPAGKTVYFAAFPTSWIYLRERGDLPPRLAPLDPGDRIWYVLQNRPGSFSDTDRALATRGRPAFVVTKLGVPLLWVFPQAECRRLSARPVTSRSGVSCETCQWPARLAGSGTGGEPAPSGASPSIPAGCRAAPAGNRRHTAPHRQFRRALRRPADAVPARSPERPARSGPPPGRPRPRRGATGGRPEAVSDVGVVYPPRGADLRHRDAGRPGRASTGSGGV
jgi:4-amino-4-deoxy-L-arabinose transferase-like glycosyltransferase